MITLTRPVVKQCPYVGELDVGELTIILDGAKAPELHDLGYEIDSMSVCALSHEEYTTTIANKLRELTEAPFTVASYWQTGGWEVVVKEERE